jgi:hypothetical protein
MFDKLDCDVEGSNVTFSLLYLGVALVELIKNHKEVFSQDTLYLCRIILYLLSVALLHTIRHMCLHRTLNS